MNNFKRVSAVVLAGMALIFASGSSHGLGFGRPTSRAILGDTLWLTVPIRLEAGEEIADECLAADVYFGDDKVAASSVSTTVLQGQAYERALKVSTTALINEPVVTVYLAAGCKARITRKFVAFADPPGMAVPQVADTSPVDSAEMVQAAALPASGARARSAGPSLSTSPVASASGLRRADVAPQSAARGRAAPVARVPRQPDPSALAGMGSMALDNDSRGLAGRAKPMRPTKGQGAEASQGARLQLDPVEADALVSPDLRMAVGMDAAVQQDDRSASVIARRQAAAAMWLALNASPEQMVRDRQRLAELEQRLMQLKQEGEQARGAITALQARVQQTQAEAGSGRWLTVLTFVAFCALALSAYLFKQLRDQKRQAQAWWQSRADSRADARTDEPPLGDDIDSAHAFAGHAHEPAAAQTAPGPAMPAAPLATATGRGKLHQLVPDAPAAHLANANLSTMPVGAVGANPPEALREVSVEELIDLEQQAEFFVVLGQDDAAIDLLEGHVHSTTGASPLPFLKLLEIYRRLDRRAEYERVQAEFNQRFNAHAPAWDSDFQHGHTLMDYPGVVERLQALWSSPIKAMEVLEKSLTRPESGADPFELPAYRELLFLYAVARDLSEREVQDRTTVDLLLPVVDASGDEPVSPLHEDTAVQPLMATRPIKANPHVRPSISLDLHLDDLQAPEQPPQRP